LQRDERFANGPNRLAALVILGEERSTETPEERGPFVYGERLAGLPVVLE